MVGGETWPCKLPLVGVGRQSGQNSAKGSKRLDDQWLSPETLQNHPEQGVREELSLVLGGRNLEGQATCPHRKWGDTPWSTHLRQHGGPPASLTSSGDAVGR